MSWELGGESVIHGALDPDPPRAGEPAFVRLTHSNAYGPVDDVAFFVRVGDLERPTTSADAVQDWVPMTVVEEVMWIDGEELPRAEAEPRMNRLEGDVWAGTFEATIVLPAGQQRIELLVASEGPVHSGVITDWMVSVP